MVIALSLMLFAIDKKILRVAICDPTKTPSTWKWHPTKRSPDTKDQSRLSRYAVEADVDARHVAVFLVGDVAMKVDAYLLEIRSRCRCRDPILCFVVSGKESDCVDGSMAAMEAKNKTTETSKGIVVFRGRWEKSIAIASLLFLSPVSLLVVVRFWFFFSRTGSSFQPHVNSVGLQFVFVAKKKVFCRRKR